MRSLLLFVSFACPSMISRVRVFERSSSTLNMPYRALSDGICVVWSQVPLA